MTTMHLTQPADGRTAIICPRTRRYLKGDPSRPKKSSRPPVRRGHGGSGMKLFAAVVTPVTREPRRNSLCTGHCRQIEAPASPAARAWATVSRAALTVAAPRQPYR
jgi:hypothetical protein